MISIIFNFANFSVKAKIVPVIKINFLFNLIFCFKANCEAVVGRFRFCFMEV